MTFLRQLFSRWTWRMAWRDTRTNRPRLALYSLSIVLGIAALAAVGALGRNLERVIEEQAKSLLGADLSIGSSEAFTPEQEEFFKSLGGEQSREVTLTTMIYLPKTESTRLTQVHALSGGFPFYGELETNPTNAAVDFRSSDGALVEENLMQQFGAQVGDTIHVGKYVTEIQGRLEKVPGESAVFSSFAPRVYIPLSALADTGLLQPGSLARHLVYFKFGSDTDVEALVKKITPDLARFKFGHGTVEERKRDLGKALENLYHFLNLVGFVALLLGGVGVASAIHLHIKNKLGTVAILRCLGTPMAGTFAIYLAQGIALGIFGALAGGTLGVFIQSLLPKIIEDFIPFKYQFHMEWVPVCRAMGIGFGICLLFALLPLLEVRRVSPLATLRVAYESQLLRRDPLRWLVGMGIAGGILAFAWNEAQDWRIGCAMVGLLGAGVGSLALAAKLTIWAARKLTPPGLPFTARQGLANLHRPNNRTLLLLLSLGMGTYLMLHLFVIQQTLLNQIASGSGKNRGNAVMFDIQNSQFAGLTNLLRSLNLPVLDDAPIVTMRLASVKGVTVESLLAKKPKRDGNWLYRREYRSTYSDHLRDGEEIVAGKWIGQAAGDTNPVPVSLEEDFSKDLKVKLGDELGFDVQGVPVTARVASLRKVEWRRIQPNFFVLFPRGVLESAPATHVLVTHVTDSDESARMQRATVKAFPNVSTIDLTLVLRTVDKILGKISFAIRFMAMFTVVTGLLVLVSTLVAGRYQRIQESVLLRTLGASRLQVIQVLLVEYVSLGILSAITGIILAYLAAALVARFLFHAPLAWEPLAIAATLFIVPTITVAVGFATSWNVLNQSPLSILRSEV